VGFILFCALSPREVSANIITEGRRWIVVVERLGIEMEVALRVVGCAFISARSRWKAVVNIPPTSPWIDAAAHCSPDAPRRRKLKHVSAAALRDAHGLPLSRQNTYGTQREIRGIPGAQINRIQTYSRVSRTLGRSFQTNFFVQTYVASVNLINCCEMARSRDPYFISAICHHVSRIFYAATCCIQNNVLSLSLCFPFSFFAPAPVIIYVKVQGLT